MDHLTFGVQGIDTAHEDKKRTHRESGNMNMGTTLIITIYAVEVS